MFSFRGGGRLNISFYFMQNQACDTSNGDINDVADVSVCANSPANIEQQFADTELPCIFPFYYNGELFDTCIQLNQDDFVFPVNICPIRNITTKRNGINSFTSEFLYEVLQSYSLCADEAAQSVGDLFPPINPDLTCSFFDRRSAFSRCRNNCVRGKLIK